MAKVKTLGAMISYDFFGVCLVVFCKSMEALRDRDDASDPKCIDAVLLNRFCCTFLLKQPSRSEMSHERLLFFPY